MYKQKIGQNILLHNPINTILLLLHDSPAALQTRVGEHHEADHAEEGDAGAGEPMQPRVRGEGDEPKADAEADQYRENAQEKLNTREFKAGRIQKL